MSKISGQFQDICEISGISGQLGALHTLPLLTKLEVNNNSKDYDLKMTDVMY